MANKDVFDEKMEALADSINAKAGTSGALTLDGMKSAVDAIELGSSVIANPTLEGGENDLTSIEIDGTKYAIPEGSSVEANPTLVGTEADLTGIEVDGVKYKVPKGSYIATMNGNVVSSESVTFIRNNYLTTPCFVPHNSFLYRITRVLSDSLLSAPVNASNALSDFTLLQIAIDNNGIINSGNQTVPRVTANPSSTSSADLTKLSVNGTTYNIPQGTEVVANPTLAGTESDLAGLEVDGTKYKVPSDYLPLAGGTMSGPIKFSNLGNLIATDGDFSLFVLSGETPHRACIGNALYNMRLDTADADIIHKRGSTNYNVLDASNTSANSTPGSTAVTLNALKLNGMSYKVRDGITNGLGYLTTAPTADNTDGIKIVVLSAEPATKYAGYLYIITA